MRKFIFYVLWVLVFLPLGFTFKILNSNSSGLQEADTRLNSEYDENLFRYLFKPFNLLLLPIIVALFLGLLVGVITDTMIKSSPFLYPLF